MAITGRGRYPMNQAWVGSIGYNVPDRTTRMGLTKQGVSFQVHVPLKDYFFDAAPVPPAGNARLLALMGVGQ